MRLDMRVAHPVVLRKDVRRKSEQQSCRRTVQARVVLRSRIVLLADDGLQNKQIGCSAISRRTGVDDLWLVMKSSSN
jgi:hypothetical protein